MPIRSACLSLALLFGAVQGGPPPVDVVQEAGEDRREPPPGAEALDAAAAELEASWADELAEAAESRVARRELAETLLGQAAEAEPAARWARLQLALRLAVESYGVESARAAINALELGFRVDGTELRRAAALGMAPQVVRVGEATRALGALALDLVEQDFSAERSAQALELIEALEPAMEAIRDRRSNPGLQAAWLRFLRLRRETEALHAALEAEARATDGPDARREALAAGRYFYFVRGQEERGLALLAAGDDLQLQMIARAEQDAPERASQQLRLADKWLGWIEEQEADLPVEVLPRRAVEQRLAVGRARARDWIQLTLAELEGDELEERRGQAIALTERLPAARPEPLAPNAEERAVAEEVRLAEAQAPPESAVGGGRVPGGVPLEVEAGESPEARSRDGRARLGQIRSNLMRTSMDSAKQVEAAVEWLLAHQSENGFWSSANFSTNCGRAGGDKTCHGEGTPGHTVATTGLAMLALLSSGRPDVVPAVQRGADWLAAQEVKDWGLLGGRLTKEYLYDQAIGTLALCEVKAFGLADDPGGLLPRAVQVLVQAQAKRGGWGYNSAMDGRTDPSVTGWCTAALLRARDLGLAVPEDALTGALAEFDAKTDRDERPGHVGYAEASGDSARTKQYAERTGFGWADDESLTAVALAARLSLEPGARDYFPRTARRLPLPEEVLERREALALGEVEQAHWERVFSSPPEWDEDESRVNFYYWCAGARAVAMAATWGARDPDDWFEALSEALGKGQATEGHATGSWSPVGPWGPAGGRVTATAMGVLALTAPWNYPF